MRIVVLQLCRMGDIVQTFPMMAALRREGHVVELVIRHPFATLPVPAESADAVHVLPPVESELTTAEACWRRISNLAAFLVPLRRRAFDLSLNLSHDAVSGWLALYLEPKAIRGVAVGRDRFTPPRDPWTQYLLTIPSNRRAGALNLADVYGHLASVSLRGRLPRIVSDPDARKRARALLAERGLRLAPEARVVGLVPGASDARKRWSAESFAEVGAALERQGFAVAVLGAPAERGLAQSVADACGDRVFSLAGETSLPVLAALLAELELVITNDTGTMHLAAGVGTTTLTITVGPAEVHESAPYGVGHVTLQPEIHCHPCDFASYCTDPVCHDQVTSSDVVAVASSLLEGRPIQPERCKGVRLYRGDVDECGRMIARPLANYPLKAEDVVRLVYRRLWEATLGVSADFPATEERLEVSLGGGSIGDDALERIETLPPRLSRLAEALDRACVELLHALDERDGAPNSVAQGLEQVSAELDLVGELEPLLRPFTAFASMQLQLSGSSSKQRVVTDLLQVLSTAANRARLFEQFLQSTLTGLRGLRPRASAAPAVELEASIPP